MLERVLEDSRVEGVDDELAIAPGQHQPRVAQDLEMMRDRGKGNGKLAGEFAGCAITITKQCEDPPATGVGEGAEGLVEHT